MAYGLSNGHVIPEDAEAVRSAIPATANTAWLLVSYFDHIIITPRRQPPNSINI